MDIEVFNEFISYKMPATTRSTPKRAVPMPARNNKKWTVTEERNLIRMCRHENNTVNEMADRLNRTPESIRYRLLTIFAAHMEGREPTDENIQDVSDWLVSAGN
jgi:hypothetical protein